MLEAVARQNSVMLNLSVLSGNAIFALLMKEKEIQMIHQELPSFLVTQTWVKTNKRSRLKGTNFQL